MLPTRQSKVPNDAGLPVEVWTKIAGNMSSRDWARVSGTCHATLAVQLTNVKVPLEGLKGSGGGRASNGVIYEAGALLPVHGFHYSQGV